MRVFADRLVDDNDKDYFRTLVLDILSVKFKATWANNKDDVFGSEKEPIFSIIMSLTSDKPTYDLILNRQSLIKILEDKLLDYNCSKSSNKMDLVFFADAVNYLCAITRILSQP